MAENTSQVNGEPQVYDNVIVGGGPGGINLALEFAERKIPYVLLERSDRFGGQFRKFPRCNELISLNKVHMPENNPGFLYGRRYDWHTLSTITEQDTKEDPKLDFTTWSDDLFPKARLVADYFEYVGNHQKWGVKDNTKFNATVTKVDSTSSGLFAITTSDGNTIHAKRLFMATGTSRPVVPDIKNIQEFGTFYSDFDPSNLDKYKNKRVVIIGAGNSAFEVAHCLRGHVGDMLIITRSSVKFARQTHNVHDVRTQSSVVYDLAQLKSLVTITAERITEVNRLPNGRLSLKTATPEPHWETPVWRNRDLITDHLIVCTGFEYTLPGVLDNLQATHCDAKKFCLLTPTWESINVPNLYFAGGSMRINDKDAASGFIHGFRYNIKALASYIAEKHHNQPLTPLFECDIDPTKDESFLPLMKYVIDMVSNNAALFELFNYGAAPITFVPNKMDGATVTSYKAQVYEPFPRDYIEARWGKDTSLTGLIIVQFQYGFQLYGEDIPSHYFTHPSDHFHTENSAYTHPIFYAFRNTAKVGEFHLQESLQARWDQDDYTDEGTNKEQYINSVFNAAAAVLGVERRKSTLPVYDKYIKEAYPPMTPEEIVDALEREPGLKLIVQKIREKKMMMQHA